MISSYHDKKLKRKRLGRSIVTTLAAIVVFVTTYALIIPAITWERTLICELEVHVHTDDCYSSRGELKCGKQEHKHTDSCFDAPKAEEKIYVCDKAEHTHSADCYFSDGTLKCTLAEHRHTIACKKDYRTVVSDPASDGAVAVITGVLPENALAEITAVPLSPEELNSYFGSEKAAQMTGFAAYDIKIKVDGEEWQPNETVSVTVRRPELEMGGGKRLGLAHVADGTESVTDVKVQEDSNGDVVFSTDGFSLYIFYTSFTVDFHYEGTDYSMDGRTAMRLSALFAELGIDRDPSGVQNVIFSDPALLYVEPVDSDWLLTSLEPFDTDETLTVTFADESMMIINVTDKPGGGGGGGGGGDGGGGGGDDGGGGSGSNGATDFSEYLKNAGKNSWQIVDKGYDGNAQSDKILISNGGGAANIYIQKNVVPTDEENEFYVYLSIDMLASLEDIFNNSQVKINNNQKWKTIGGFTDDLTLNGQVTGLYEHGDMSGGNNYEVYIYVYQNRSSTTPLYSYYDIRTGTAPNCSNGTAFLLLPGLSKYLTVQTPISLGEGHNGKTIEMKIYLDQISIAGIFNKPVFTSVVDKVGDYITGVEVRNEWCDGTVEYDSDTRTITWFPEPNKNVDPTIMINPITGWNENVAQLVYKVRLDTGKTNFNSCADNMDSSISDPDSYKVNESAVATYHTETIPGAIGPTESPDLTAVFPIPYVRGLLYDIRFKKVSPAGVGLPGAVFRLLDEDRNPIKDKNGKDITFISDTDGYVNMLDLTALPIYVEEITPPPGYQYPANPVFGPFIENWTKAGTTNSQRAANFTQETLTGSTDNMRFKGKDNGGKLWEILNTNGYEFPETGGAGTELFYGIGALLMFGALTIGFILWRRREGRGEM